MSSLKSYSEFLKNPFSVSHSTNVTVKHLNVTSVTRTSSGTPPVGGYQTCRLLQNFAFFFKDAGGEGVLAAGVLLEKCALSNV